MSYEVSPQEKQQAEQALLHFDHALKQLNIATDHLDIMGTAFKDHPNIQPDELIKFRSALRKYRDKAIKNFNTFKAAAFKCIDVMQAFTSDTQTSKLIRSFISSIDGIEDQVNKWAELFDNIKANTYITDINKSVEEIHKLCDELKEIIDDRIKGHIKSNIIGKSWLDGVSNELQLQIQKKTPILLDLMKDQQEALNNKKQ